MRCLVVLAFGIGGLLPHGAQSAEMERLFFSPAQRAQLDIARAQRDRRGTQTADGTPSGPQGSDVVTYDGVVRRTDGKSTVWLNGKPVNDRTSYNDVNVVGVRVDGAVTIAVPQADRAASLRVGQTLDINSGSIREAYARDATRYRPPEKATAPASPVKPAAAAASTGAAAKRVARRDEIDPESGAAPPERDAKTRK